MMDYTKLYSLTIFNRKPSWLTKYGKAQSHAYFYNFIQVPRDKHIPKKFYKFLWQGSIPCVLFYKCSFFSILDMPKGPDILYGISAILYIIASILYNTLAR